MWHLHVKLELHTIKQIRIINCATLKMITFSSSSDAISFPRLHSLGSTTQTEIQIFRYPSIICSSVVLHIIYSFFGIWEPLVSTACSLDKEYLQATWHWQSSPRSFPIFPRALSRASRLWTGQNIWLAFAFWNSSYQLIKISVTEPGVLQLSNST